MNTKLKAKELLDKMSSQTYSYQPYAGAHYSTEEIGREAGKKCALIYVEEILKEWMNEDGRNAKQNFWKEVKVELETSC